MALRIVGSLPQYKTSKVMASPSKGIPVVQWGVKLLSPLHWENLGSDLVSGMWHLSQGLAIGVLHWVLRFRPSPPLCEIFFYYCHHCPSGCSYFNARLQCSGEVYQLLDKVIKAAPKTDILVVGDSNCQEQWVNLALGKPPTGAPDS